MSKQLFLLAVLATCSAPAIANAQSLFERSDQCRLSPVVNNVARCRGDLLVVLINESSDVENIDERSLDRTGTSQVNATLNYGLGGNLGTQNGSSNLGQQSNQIRAFTGDSEFRSERQFQDRFTVTVMDVLPNGNMLIEGRRKVSLQGDTRTLQLTGIVRNFDVLPNNIVSSQLVGNLQIRLLADGPEEEVGKQGWLAKRLNKWLPF